VRSGVVSRPRRKAIPAESVAVVRCDVVARVGDRAVRLRARGEDRAGLERDRAIGRLGDVSGGVFVSWSYGKLAADVVSREVGGFVEIVTRGAHGWDPDVAVVDLRAIRLPGGPR